MRHIGAAVADTIFPPWCLSCQAPGAWVCGSCQQASALLPLGWCGSCNRTAAATSTLCRRDAKRLRVSRLTSAFAYSEAVERVIRAVKYRPARIGLSSLVDHDVRDRLAQAISPGALVVPIPAQSDHEERRGFNQAHELARLLVPVDRMWSRQLVRTRAVPAQVGLQRTERLANMHGVFAWRGHSLARQTVCLVDDVLTTGATLADAARAVRAAGACTVVAVTLAQTPPGRERPGKLP